MEVRDTHPARISRNLRPLPFHRKCDRRIAENAEVITIVGVLPNVFAGEYEIPSKCLLDSRMKLVAPAWSQRRRLTRFKAPKKRVQHRVAAPDTGKHQVFVEGCFQHTRIRNPQYGVGLLYVVGDPKAWLGFPMGRKAIVKIPA